MSGLVPPWVADRHAREPWEKRLAARYVQASSEDRNRISELWRRQEQRAALFRRLRRSEPRVAYMWLADAAMDPPELLADLTVGDVLERTFGSAFAAPEAFRYLVWSELEGWQRRWLQTALSGFAGPR